MSRLEWCFVAAIVAILVLFIVGFERNASDFKAACDQVGGRTVWDGRQHQCMPKAQEQKP